MLHISCQGSKSKTLIKITRLEIICLGKRKSISNYNEEVRANRSIGRPVKILIYSSEDDQLPLQRVEQGLPWDDISDTFPKKNKQSLQVHYSTKLKTGSKDI